MKRMKRVSLTLAKVTGNGNDGRRAVLLLLLLLAVGAAEIGGGGGNSHGGRLKGQVKVGGCGGQDRQKGQ